MAKYIHDQSAPSSTWTVNHDLGSEPICDILVIDNGVLTKTFPLTLEHVDTSQMVITFSIPRQGIVTCVSYIDESSFNIGPMV